jgi:formate dehydrogenase maturation protein FdhE
MGDFLGYINYTEMLDIKQYPILNDKTRNEMDFIDSVKKANPDLKKTALEQKVQTELRENRKNVFGARVSRIRNSAEVTPLGLLLAFSSEKAYREAQNKFSFRDGDGNEVVLFHRLEQLSSDMPANLPEIVDLLRKEMAEKEHLKSALKKLESLSQPESSGIDKSVVSDILTIFSLTENLFEANVESMLNIDNAADLFDKISQMKKKLQGVI